MDLELVARITGAVRAEVGKVIVGMEGALELLLCSLMCGGHVLLEGVPGTGKTLLVQSFAMSLGLQFGRIQFTPDMMPGDIIGTNLFNFQTNEFTLTPGPVFTEILLADEINRTPPKTQAALLQAMSERAVTIDRRTLDLGDDFLVAATQNPIEQQGTYPLPEAQLDRFLFKILLDYPSRDEEIEIVRRHGSKPSMPKPSSLGVGAVANKEHVAYARAAAASVRLADPLAAYIVDVIRATRAHPAVETGASPRSAAMLSAASRAFAALQGRDFAIPDDVKILAAPLLRHRLVMTPSSDIEGFTPDRAVMDILNQIPAPR
ncbi:MAG: MoxR family ATPase [Deltaproteobacteria bacterium]|nr:MoxR family ATPase [Deltaproteobacteria bacterium]